MCDEGFGVAHSHAGRMAIVEDRPFQSLPPTRRVEWVPTGEVRIWVNWRDAYKALSCDGR